MAIYTTLAYNAVSLLLLTIDITAFFLVVSTIMLVRPISWLLPFHHAGDALVRGYTGLVDHWWIRFHRRPLSLRCKHIVGLLILEVVRLILVSLVSIL